MINERAGEGVNEGKPEQLCLWLEADSIFFANFGFLAPAGERFAGGECDVNGSGNSIGDGGAGYFLVAVRILLLVAREKTREDIPGGGKMF